MKLAIFLLGAVLINAGGTPRSTIKEQISSFFVLTTKTKNQDSVQKVMLQINQISEQYLRAEKPSKTNFDFLDCINVIDSLPSGQDVPEFRDLSTFLQNAINSLQEISDLMEYAIPDAEGWEEVEQIIP